MMARTALHTLIIFSTLHSCSSIRPIISSDSDTQSEVKAENLSVKPLSRDLEETVVIGEELPPVVTPSKVNGLDEDIVKAEEEIVQTFGKEDLKKEDPVTSVAESEAALELDYKQKHYKFWMKYFTTRNKDRFTRHVKNGLKYKKAIENIFEEEGLPKDLFYVGLIESGYNTHIKSHASAVGPWQFIKGTAKRYNLYVDSYLDERTNIFKATRAAANYFKDLYNIFGSWELALCAYNAGEYRIINAIRRGNTRDYKELVSKRLLPKETIFYIPKVAAAKEIVRRHYSKTKIPRVAKLYNNAFEVEIDKPISLKKVAKTLKVNYKTLKSLNPDVRRDYVGRRRHYSLYVPENISKVAVSKIAKMPKAKRRVIARIPTENTVHRVRRGESLYKIARKYGTTIAKLKRGNNLKRNKIFVGQKLRVRTPASSSYYVVKRGDNLSTIASHHGMGLRALKRLNGLRSSKIYVGQRLKVSGSATKVYVVRRGDNLYQIAKRFGISVKRIVQANSLKDKRIFPKQKIILPI